MSRRRQEFGVGRFRQWTDEDWANAVVDRRERSKSASWDVEAAREDARQFARVEAENEKRTRQGGLTRIGDDAPFPFEAWARDNGYPYDRAWLPALKLCASGAEVYFIRPLLERGVELDGSVLVCDILRVVLQHKIRGYRTDFLIEDGTTRLAVEVDGLALHTRKAEQVAADYLRMRRIVLQGYVVIRFTAQEVFGDARECWRQIDAILDVRRRAA